MQTRSKTRSLNGGGKPSHSSKTKTKKPKYLSLRRLTKSSSPTPPPASPPPSLPPPPWPPSQQPNLPSDRHVDLLAPSTLFAAAPSLTDILGSSSSSSSLSPSDSPSLLDGDAVSEEELARRALRGRERWVYCCGSASTSVAAATASSPSSSDEVASSVRRTATLLLKLDYDDIIAAWADRSSLYIDGAGETHVKQEIDHYISADSPVFVEVGTAVPERSDCYSKTEDRKERVRRYKEKRRSRLFGKRILYDVRRANAVKRPRYKGRFIKAEGIQIKEETEMQLS